MQCLSWPISPLLFAYCEYKRRFFTGWVSVVNIKQLSRWTKSSLFLLSLAALCKFLFCYTFPRLIWMFQAVWGGGKEAQVVFRQHERHHLHPADCFHLLCDLKYNNNLRREEEEKNHLLGRDVFSKNLQRNFIKRGGEGGHNYVFSLTVTTCYITPPPPPSQSPTRFQAHSAHRPAETHVHRFEPKNLEYFLPCSICLTDMFLLLFISIHVFTFNSTNKCVQTK